MRLSDNTASRIKLNILRVIVYAILIFLCALCLFFFYLMIINSSRSNAELAKGFSLLPSGNFMTNLKNSVLLKKQEKVIVIYQKDQKKKKKL